MKVCSLDSAIFLLVVLKVKTNPSKIIFKVNFVASLIDLIEKI